MGDDRSDLPEGTDTIIDGALNTDEAPVVDRESATSKRSPGRSLVGSGNAETGLNSETDRTGGDSGNLIERLRSGSENLTSQAGERARGLVSQGLERSADALSNVSKLVGDTAAGLDERLGPEFGEYARKAATAIESTANSIASKDPDELIEDTRNFVRNSPGVAIAGAAIVGFALARLFKSGISSRDEDDDA